MKHPKTETDLETKMGHHSDLVTVLDDLAHTFEAFKDANDERLHQLERRMSSDVVTEEKVDRINRTVDEQQRHLDELMLKGKRPGLDRADVSVSQLEHRSAFQSYVRSGEETSLRRFEEKAMSSGADADGGFLVPETLSDDIGKRLSAISPVRAISTVREVSSSVYKKPFASTGPVVGWVGETDVRPETASPALAELAFPTMELYAMPAATSALLDDAAIDIDAWIAEEVEAAFAEQESAAFINGDGTNKPAGFLSAPVVDENSWSWGNLGFVPTGEDGALATANSGDVLIDTIYALKAGYRQNATFVMNRKTQAVVRKLKDNDGNYLWSAPAAADAKATLMGFQVVEAEDMPDIASGSLSIAFGDFRRGYLVVDRTGVRVLRDPYSSKPYVLFYTTKRVGGGIQDYDAIKLIKFGTA